MRALLFLGGIAGAAGVILAAAGSHLTSDLLQTAGTIAMAHAPALLALGVVAGRGGSRLFLVAGIILAAGLTLFAADLVMRAQAGYALFPLAAPAGGILLIVGWLAVAVAAIADRDA